MRGELRRAVRERRRDPGGAWRRLAARRGAGGARSAVQPYLEARDGIKSQLEDLALFLRRYADGIEASPARLQQVEERLALLERLKRKYGPTLADVVARRDALRRELADLRARRRAARGARAASTRRPRRRTSTAAQALSAARRQRRRDFAGELEALLGELAMERTRFEVRFAEAGLRRGRRGPPRASTRREFFVSPNPGEDLRPLARIVSGGELSRIMLAIKTLTATSRARLRARPTTGRRARRRPGLIFDEVDAGIGGRVADVVGRKLRALGSAFQVLCITHLPQIAAYADTHFQIEKRVERGRTRTTGRRRLDEAGAVEELGRMLGGATRITDGLRRRRVRCLDDGRGVRRRKAKRKRKAKAKGRKRKRDVRTKDARYRRVRYRGSENMARKYLIETFGCQMNVHDSERMAGLLEQAGFEADRRRRRRRRRRHQHVQRARARRREALHAARRAARSWRPSTGTIRSSPSPAAWRSRKARRILKRSPGVADVIVGTQAIRRLPMLVERGRRARARGRVRSISTRTTT